MNKLVEKVCFGDEYFRLEHKERVVVILIDTGKSMVMSAKQYEMFEKMRELKNDRAALDKYVQDVPESYRLLLSMAEKGIVTLKPLSKSDENNKGRHISAYWGVTESCNFHCLYCYACAKSVQESAEFKNNLSLEQCYQIVDKIMESGFHELVITGGEPLLNPKTFSIGEYAKNKGMLVGLLTNGSLVKRHPIEEFQRSFHYVKISLDSSVKEHNDLVRGKGSYDKIVEGIEYLVNGDIIVTLGSVLTKYNTEDIAETIHMVHDRFGITDHQIINHIPIGRGTDSGLGCDFKTLEKCDEVIRKTKGNVLGDKLFSVLQDQFVVDDKKVCCGMGNSEIFINEKADVYPCRMTYSEEYRLGNVLEEDLDTILARVDKIVDGLHVDKLEGCKDCDYKYLCGGGCRMYHAGFSGSIYKNSPDVCEAIKRQCKDLIFLKNGIDIMSDLEVATK